MKPIIMDMKDMSESREVYESRPNPVMAGFIYLILVMAVAALLWMGFCRIDIVVKATGTIGAAEEVATVTNRVAGTITERMIEDGQRVEKGDVLYTVSHEELTLQLSALEEQLADLKDKEEMLQAYGSWLETGEEFPTILADNPYYSETVSRKLLAELGEQSTLQAYAGELSAYEAKLYANSTMTDYYSNAIDKSRKLIEAVKKRENPFGQGEDYYRNYMENYLSQYQNTIIQYDDRIKVLQKESSEAAQAMEALEAEKQALQVALPWRPFLFDAPGARQLFIKFRFGVYVVAVRISIEPEDYEAYQTGYYQTYRCPKHGLRLLNGIICCFLGAYNPLL